MRVDTHAQVPIIITTTLLNIIVFFRYAQVRGAKLLSPLL